MGFSSFLLAFFLLATASSSSSSSSSEVLKTYLVHVSKSEMPMVFATHKDWYTSAVALVKGVQAQSDAEQMIVYTYDNVFHGFAAKLTESQAAELDKVEGIVAIFPAEAAQLHTTRTPEFLGLKSGKGLWQAAHYGEDVIVGVLDSGVWPERASFSDHRLGPVPARWKGKCEDEKTFSATLCNRKLIGARAFYKGYEAAAGPINETAEFKSARDSNGHGTHTSSTAAGSVAYRASMLGYAKGTARGMAPQARLAIYKLCWKGGCFDPDQMAAFEQAVADGVDIISLSQGGPVRAYHKDPIAIGAFAAMEKGIVTSCSAGNSGPAYGSVTNVAPWILTIAASSLDRDFPSPIKLGNGVSYNGVSLYSGKGLGGKQLDLVYVRDLDNPNYLPGSVDAKKVARKILFWEATTNATVIVPEMLGAAGVIVANTAVNGKERVATSHLSPAVLVSYNDGLAIKAYIHKTAKPTATMAFLGTALGVKPAPVMAAFSSRGPNPMTPEILKPDLTAPGVNILAAWTGSVGPTGEPGDNRVVDFNIISGTSMSCPHVSGLAALLKGAHPRWSAAAIKSALMTTSLIYDNTGAPLSDSSGLHVTTPLAHGSGHVNPEAALHPGLVYDLGPQDYVDFLCSQHYTHKMLHVFTKGKYHCSRKGIRPGDLNYPSFSIVFKQKSTQGSYKAAFSRTVTNVGAANSVYTATVTPPAGVKVWVEPSVLSFKEQNEKLSYTLTFYAKAAESSLMTFGSLLWSNDFHQVRSPIMFTWQMISTK